MKRPLTLKSCPSFTHPTFEHFLLFHLGPYVFADDYQENRWSGARVIDALRQKGFPVEHTRIGANVHLVGEDLGKRPTLLCAKGEPAAPVIVFLADKMMADRENGRDRKYGPVMIASARYHDDFVTYYDYAVRDVFRSSIVRTLFADPSTQKTTWYGRVNGYAPEKYLEAIVNQLVELRGLSMLVSHLNSQKGAMILTDAARSASLAITLVGLLNRRVPDQIIHTVGLACFVQHFGALFNEKDHYPGKYYDPADEDTIKALASLGISEHTEDILSDLGVANAQLLHILRYNPKTAKQEGEKPSSLYLYFAMANQFVALYFTEQRRVFKNDVAIDEENPTFGDSVATMKELDRIFADTPFYHHHRDKVYFFLENAKRYYKSHIWSRIKQGGFVSSFQRQQAAS